MLIKDEKLRARMGKMAKGTSKTHFLLTRYQEQYLDLFNSFKTVFNLNKGVDAYR
jgi:hypothetical protein